MDNGWIKLHRDLLDNAIIEKPEYAWLWCVLLLKANHKTKTFIWNNNKTECKEGQLLTSRKKLAEITCFSESKIERILKYLEIEQQIEQQTTTKYRLITIINWEKYQGNGQQNGQQVNNKRTTNGHKQECKELKNKEKIYKKEKALEKKSFGEFVLLTGDQYQKLITKFGKKLIDEYIDKLNLYIGTKGRKYKSHYHVIQSWLKKEEVDFYKEIKSLGAISFSEKHADKFANEEECDKFINKFLN